MKSLGWILWGFVLWAGCDVDRPLGPGVLDDVELLPGLDLAGTAPADLTGTPAPVDLAMPGLDIAVAGPDLPVPDLGMIDMGGADLALPVDLAPPPPRDMAGGGMPVGAVVINEVHPSNVNGVADEDGEKDDWIELYNTTASPIDLTGVGLSTKPNNPYEWTFPAGAAIAAKQFLVVFASSKNRTVPGRPLHTNYTINNGVDSVSLTAPGRVQLDNFAPARSKMDVSWCRVPDAMGPFQLCMMPTPGASNGGTAYPSMLTPPSFSVAGGFYNVAQNVELVASDPGAIVRYTLDTTDPTVNSPQYQAPIPVSAVHAPGTYKLTVIRAASFANGRLTSPTNTHSYIVDANVANIYPTNLIAINCGAEQITGPNGIITNATKMANGDYLDIAAASSIEYFRPDRSLAFRVDGAVKLAGQLSRTFPQKSFDLKFKDAYGPRTVTEKIFLNRPYKTFRDFRVRDGSTDYKWALMRDTLMGMAANDMPLMPAGDHNRSVVFLNGEYYGQMEVREHCKQDWMAEKYGIDPNNVDIIDTRGGPHLEYGDLEAYNAWNAWVNNHKAELAADYDLLRAVMDPDTLANYIAIELYGNNVDWPNNNERFWRARAQDTPWRFVANDLDLTLDCPFAAGGGPAANPFNKMTGGGSNTSKLFLAATANPTFKNYLINVFADLMNTAFSIPVAEANYNTLVTEMTPLMPEFYTRWPQNTVQGWMNEHAKVINYLRAREAGFLPHIVKQFALSNQPRYTLTVNVNDPKMGTVLVNTVNLGLGGRLVDVMKPWTGKYFPGVPITVTALPAPGFKFTGWQGASMSMNITESLNLNQDSALTATFAADPGWMPPVKPQPPAPPPGMRNLAMGAAAATQSSTANSAYAALAIDGDAARAVSANTTAITNSEANAWWQVDLGQNADIFRVDLVNKVDMADFAIFVSAADMTGRSYADLLADQSVWRFVQRGPGYHGQSRLVQKKGRYVRVQRSDTGALTLMEVMVQGVPAASLVPDPSALRSLALGRGATSSSDGGGAASLAVDGNADPMAKTVAITNPETAPWWEVDLGAKHVIGEIHINANSRPGNFWVFVSSQPMAGRTLMDLQADPNVWKRDVPRPIGTLVRLSGETAGRYVRVQRKDPMVALNLVEVVVLGLVEIAP